MKPDPFYGFLAIYIGLISMTILAHALYFSEVFVSYGFSTNFSCSIALVSLTQISGDVFVADLPNSYIFFSLIITQISGTILLSYLLYFSWNFFGEKPQNPMTLKSAYILTTKVSLMIEACLLAFFLYAIPVQLTGMDWMLKTIAALSTSINSFFLAGFSHNAHFFHEGTINQNFLIQIGIIAGTTIGGLGIFVIHELFSPRKLRERLANPEIDWTYITKVSVFGSAFVLVVYSVYIYFFKAGTDWPEKNMMDSIFASIYQASSARGFGYSIVPPDHSRAGMIVSVFGTGPFSTSGGITLLSIAWVVLLFQKKAKKSINLRKIQTILKWLLIYSSVVFVVLTALLWFVESERPLTEICMDQLALFTANNLEINTNTEIGCVLMGLTNSGGRIGLMLACFLTLRHGQK